MEVQDDEPGVETTTTGFSNPGFGAKTSSYSLSLKRVEENPIYAFEQLDEKPSAKKKKKKTMFSNGGTKPWKILTAIMALVSLGCIGALVYVIVANGSDSAATGGAGNASVGGQVGSVNCPTASSEGPTRAGATEKPKPTRVPTSSIRPKPHTTIPSVSDEPIATDVSTQRPGATDVDTPEPTTASGSHQSSKPTTTTTKLPGPTIAMTSSPSTASKKSSPFTPSSPMRATALPVVAATFDGPPVTVDVPTQSYARLHLPVSSAATMNMKLKAAAVGPVDLAVYGRQTQQPTHTRYNFTSAFSHDKKGSGNADFDVSQAVDPGDWYISVFNGAKVMTTIEANFTKSDPPRSCPNDCSNHGICFNGVCACNPKFKGRDCSEANCAVADCNGHGKCVNGICLCVAGWKGVECEEVDCIPSDCNGNGQCVSGKCVCDPGYRGATCDIAPRKCPLNCAGRGKCDTITGLCSCVVGWTGLDCNTALCTDNCNRRGRCDNGTCVCNAAWTGATCDTLACPAGCDVHGTCMNGTCLCDKGWRGDDCLTDACPKNCSFRGSCGLGRDGFWECQCISGFRGLSCQIGVELLCNDGIDNDFDLFTDCDDPDCCNESVCAQDPSCVSAPDPADFVGNETANGTLSFYETIEFLFTSGIQSGVDLDALDKSRVSVIKGNVTTRDTTPLVGVTVGVLGQPQMGYTLTRRDGSYDIAVIGGGSVTLRYTRGNLIGSQRSVSVGWNEYALLDDVAMVPVDTKVTELDFSNNEDEVKVAESTPVEDDEGSRKGVIMFPAGVKAVVVGRNGSGNSSVEKPSIRLTEYTVGNQGQQSMPAELPAFTGYTYATEMSMDQAAVNGSTEVVFSKPLHYYVNNYLGFPVGSAVPIGFYNRTLGEWVASPNGRVVQYIGIGLASDNVTQIALLDLNGDGQAATPAELEENQVTEKELANLVVQYNVSQTLWRVPVAHFTPWDCNWPYGPPLDGCTPFQCNPEDPITPPIVESVDSHDIVAWPRPTFWRNPFYIIVLTGPMSRSVSARKIIQNSIVDLFYHSNRQAGSRTVIQIPLTAARLPPSLRKVHLKINIKGKVTREVFGPQPGQIYRFLWNKRDAYNRIIKGSVTAEIEIGYEYPLVYYSVRSQWRQSFNRLSDASISRAVYRRGRSATFWEKKSSDIKDSSSFSPVGEAGLGGWSISVHHTYDPGSGSLVMGNGESIKFRDKSKIIRSAAGTGSQAPEKCPSCADSRAADRASLRAPCTLATGDDGSVYVGDYPYIYRLGPNSNMTAILDLSSRLPQYAYYMAVSPVDGDLFVSYAPLFQVIRIKKSLLESGQLYTLTDIGNVDGLSVFAGNGESCRPWDLTCGDSGPAAGASLIHPKGLAIGPRGTVYLADGKLIRQIGNDGNIATFAGSRLPRGCAPPGCCNADTGNVPLDEAYFTWPTELFVKSDDESLYVVDGRNILHVSREGQVRVVAGRAPHIPPKIDKTEGDDPAVAQYVPKPALQVNLELIRGISITSSGSIFFGETDNNRVHRIRLLTTKATIITYAGTVSTCNCASSRCNCYAGDNLAVPKARFFTPSSLTLSADGSEVYIADQRNYRVRRAFASLPKKSSAGYYTIPSPDGSELFHFDITGRHLSTDLTATGAERLIFNYKEYNSRHLLSSITTSGNKDVVINRDPNGEPLSLVTEAGMKYSFGVDANGYLNEITEPDGQISSRFDYLNDVGLLKSITESDGSQHRFTYTKEGRLEKLVTPTGRTSAFYARQERGAFTAVVSTSGNRNLTIEAGDVLTVAYPDGKRTVEQELYEGNVSVTFPDGAVSVELDGESPVFGGQLGSPSHLSVKLPSGNLKEVSAQRTAVFLKQDNPATLQSTSYSFMINKANWFRVDYTKSTRTRIARSMRSNRELNVVFNKAGLPVSITRIKFGLLPIVLTYDSSNLLLSVSQGNVSRNFTYDAFRRVTEEVLGDGQKIVYAYQKNEVQPFQITLPGKRAYNLSYDISGSLATVTTPGKSQFKLMRARDKQTKTLAFSIHQTGGASSFNFTFDIDSNPSLLSFKTRSVSFHTDAKARLEKIKFGDQQINYEYDPVTAQTTKLSRKKEAPGLGAIAIGAPGLGGGDIVVDGLSSMSVGSSSIEYGWNGPYLSSITQRVTPDTGEIVTAVFSFAYDNYFRLIRRSVKLNQQSSQSEGIAYGSNGDVTTLGKYTLSYPQDNSAKKSYGSSAVQVEWDGNGRLSKRTLTISGKTVCQLEVLYTSTSLVRRKEVTLGQSKKVYEYEYTDDWRVRRVLTDGKETEKYAYDSNGNRLTTSGTLKHSAAFDKNDRVTKVDSIIYKRDAADFVTKRGRHIVSYSTRGELKEVIDDTSFIALNKYVYDAYGRRSSRTQYDVQTFRETSTIYLYGDLFSPYRVTHVVEKEGSRLSTLRYDPLGHVFQSEGPVTYYYAADVDGSPLAVIDGSGKIVKEVVYSAFGEVVSDTKRDQEVYLGYRGCLADSVLGTVATKDGEYDPLAGQLISRDVIKTTDVVAVPGSPVDGLIDKAARISKKRLDLSYFLQNAEDGEKVNWLGGGGTPQLPSAMSIDAANVGISSPWETMMRSTESLESTEDAETSRSLERYSRYKAQL